MVYWKANGIDIAIVEESTSNRALEGYTAGQEDARLARDAVIVSGGPSNGGAIHFAVDFDTTSDDQRKRIDRYLSGAASILGWPQVGVYGEYEVIDHVVRHLPISFRWQTYAWSHGRVHPMVTLYQYSNGQMLGGVEVDLCRALADNFGQWNWIAPTVPPSTRGDGGIGLA